MNRWNNRQANNHRGWERDPYFRQAFIPPIWLEELRRREREYHELLVNAIGAEWDEVKACQAKRALGRGPAPTQVITDEPYPVGIRWAEPPKRRRLFAQVAAMMARTWARVTRRTGRSRG